MIQLPPECLIADFKPVKCFREKESVVCLKPDLAEPHMPLRFEGACHNLIVFP